MCDCGDPQELLEFPCHYTFKAVGVSGKEFCEGIFAAARHHAAVSRDAVHVRPSGKGNYQSVSIIARLDSYQQLTSIYAAMKEVPGLKMLL